MAAPRVGLLTIGTEEGKGDRLRRAVAPVLAATLLPARARYAGLVEGNDVVLGGAVEVVVTDGFTGNVLLKGLETAYALIGTPPADRPPRCRRARPSCSASRGPWWSATAPPDAADLAGGIALAADLHRRAAIAAIAGLIGNTEVVHDQ
jgi:glycerol-3-phosphate acyltransferase PlsX